MKMSALTLLRITAAGVKVYCKSLKLVLAHVSRAITSPRQTLEQNRLHQMKGRTKLYNFVGGSDLAPVLPSCRKRHLKITEMLIFCRFWRTPLQS
jgi:hypothetical protein